MPCGKSVASNSFCARLGGQTLIQRKQSVQNHPTQLLKPEGGHSGVGRKTLHSSGLYELHRYPMTNCHEESMTSIAFSVKANTVGDDLLDYDWTSLCLSFLTNQYRYELI